ncbi:MAG TPA: GumC family protein [Devosiaceae bacterium]|jgi:uncharacterized protein involved in exopolysaccharide biosynthesis
MSVSDMFNFSANKSGARAFARLDTDAAARKNGPATARMPVEAEPVTTVTLNKIGDFLELDFSRLFAWLRAGLAVAVVLAAVGAVAGGAYGIFSKPKYTVEADVLIDPSNLQVVANDLYSSPGQVDGQVLNAGSMLRVMTSGSVLSRVVDELDLVDDKEFYDPTPSFSISKLFGGGNASTAKPDPKLAALGSLAQRVSTRADEKSFVATLTVSAETPDKAVHISDAIVQAFQDELAKAEADGAARAAATLNDRLDTLKSGVKDAEEKVEAYKRANNLVSADGQLVSTQSMTQLNGQVGDAQSRVIAAQSNYDSIVAAGRNATTSDTVASAALAALRDKASGLQQQLDSQSMVLGPRHPTIVQLQAELATVNGQLKTEVGRIVATAKASLDEAKATLAALHAKTDSLKSSVFTDNESQVALRELERDATSKTAIYETFLQRAQQITEQERIDTTNVRVISTAVPPADRSWPPRTVLVVIIGAFAGFAFGLVLAIGMGIIRDLRQPKRSRITI